VSAGTIPVSLYRGGTSKGVFLRLDALSLDAAERNALALALLGSPDPMQLDGLGGTHSSTSKLVAVGTPAEARARGHDVPDEAQIVYLFGQIAVDRPTVDWRGNCGNLTAAVAAFALRERLLPPAGEQFAEVELFNLNTAVRITATQPLEDGTPRESGDFAMPGVPGTGARIDLTFHDPATSTTGRVLPTGRPSDVLHVDGQELEASIVDVSNPVVIIRAGDLGLDGTEPPNALNADARLLARIERIRGLAAVLCGLVSDPARAVTDSPAIPRVILVAPPVAHHLESGERVADEDADVVVRTSSMGVIHHAFTGSGLIAAAAAAAIPGTVFDGIGGRHRDGVRLAHPKGVVPVTAAVDTTGPQPKVRTVSVARTARLLMRGDAHPRPPLAPAASSDEEIP